jgi:hypothetical protein
MSTWGKLKQKALQKMGKAERSVADPELAEALDVLATSRQNMETLVRTGAASHKALSAAQEAGARHGEAAAAFGVAQHGELGEALCRFGEAQKAMEDMRATLASMLEADINSPLELFVKEDLEEARAAKHTYYQATLAYDAQKEKLAALQKNESKNGGKIPLAQSELEALERARNEAGRNTLATLKAVEDKKTRFLYAKMRAMLLAQYGFHQNVFEMLRDLEPFMGELDDRASGRSSKAPGFGASASAAGTKALATGAAAGAAVGAGLAGLAGLAASKKGGQPEQQQQQQQHTPSEKESNPFGDDDGDDHADPAAAAAAETPPSLPARPAAAAAAAAAAPVAAAAAPAASNPFDDPPSKPVPATPAKQEPANPFDDPPPPASDNKAKVGAAVAVGAAGAGVALAGASALAANARKDPMGTAQSTASESVSCVFFFFFFFFFFFVNFKILLLLFFTFSFPPPTARPTPRPTPTPSSSRVLPTLQRPPRRSRSRPRPRPRRLPRRISRAIRWPRLLSVCLGPRLPRRRRPRPTMLHSGQMRAHKARPTLSTRVRVKSTSLAPLRPSECVFLGGEIVMIVWRQRNGRKKKKKKK